MGSYLFHWDHPASEVFVTGTFDDWGKTVKLVKTVGDRHEKLVTLPKADEKILYKFVVDGNWTNDHTKPTETDSIGNKNNYLLPTDITKNPAAATMSNTATNTTVQGLAGQVPKEGAAGGVPGAFPETPAGDVTVDPLPATAGAGNPIQLKAGEPVPPASQITGNKIGSAVTTDKASYEKGNVPVLPDVVTPEAERGSGWFGLPEQSKNMIPESSLPVAGGPGTTTINSVGAGATTAQLAGQVPLEPKGVPEVVKESQAEAKAAPEASANPEAVKEKSQVEKELEAKVPEEPPATESTIGGKAAAAIGAGVAGVATVAAAASSKLPAKEDVAAQLPAKEDVKAKLPESVQPAVDKVAPNGTAGGSATSPTVPNVVQESISDAHTSPEAAANTEAVTEKKEVESELLKTVKPDESAGAPAPTASAATATEAPKATMKSTEEPLRDTARPAGAEPAKPGSAMAQAIGEQKKTDSRDVSPMTRPDGTHAETHVEPEVTTGVGSSKAPKESGPSSPLSPKGASSSGGKEKRSSGFFRKLKERFEHHDKKEKK